MEVEGLREELVLQNVHPVDNLVDSPSKGESEVDKAGEGHQDPHSTKEDSLNEVPQNVVPGDEDNKLTNGESSSPEKETDLKVSEETSEV